MREVIRELKQDLRTRELTPLARMEDRKEYLNQKLELQAVAGVKKGKKVFAGRWEREDQGMVRMRSDVVHGFRQGGLKEFCRTKERKIKNCDGGE